MLQFFNIKKKTPTASVPGEQYINIYNVDKCKECGQLKMKSVKCNHNKSRFFVKLKS